MKQVMILTGAGQIGMAIARRMGAGMKIVIGDKSPQHAALIAETMNRAGFDAIPVEMDLSSRDSILALIDTARSCGEISMLVNAAGVSPSQASVETILRVDLYGTAVLLDEVGRVISRGGVGVTVSSQSGHRLPALGEEADRLLATTPAEELLALEILQPRNIRDTLHAYQLAKRCNVKRVMAETVKWGRRGARINSISPGIIVTPLALDEFNGPCGDFYKEMFARCPAGRPGTADEVARNGVAGMRHVFLRRNPNMDVRRFKLIREYRALVHGVYKRVTEEFQILKTDRAGNVWLVLSIVNLSANQQPPYKVASQLIDTPRGIPFRRSTTFSTARRSSRRASGRCCIASRRAARARRSPTNCTSASIRSTPTGSGSSRNSASTTRSKRSSTPGSSGFSMPDY